MEVRGVGDGYIAVLRMLLLWLWFFPFFYEKFRRVPNFEAHFYEYGVRVVEWEHAVFG
jgi:hypothetical protein